MLDIQELNNLDSLILEDCNNIRYEINLFDVNGSEEVVLDIHKKRVLRKIENGIVSVYNKPESFIFVAKGEDGDIKFDTAKTVFFVREVNVFLDRITLEMRAYTNFELVNASGFPDKKSHVFDIVGIDSPKKRLMYPLTINLDSVSRDKIIFDSFLLELLLRNRVIVEGEPGALEYHGLIPQFQLQNSDEQEKLKKVSYDL